MVVQVDNLNFLLEIKIIIKIKNIIFDLQLQAQNLVEGKKNKLLLFQKIQQMMM